MTTLVLQVPHNHAGKPYLAGQRIEVDRGSAEWLIAQGIARRVPTPVLDPVKPETDSKPIQRKEPKP